MPSRLPRRVVRPRLIIAQLAALAAVVAVLAVAFHNTVTNLASRGITGGFAFLERAARFPIAESVLPYSPADTFAWAYVVGVGNTLCIALLVAALSTTLGLLVGLARGSHHPLVSGLATAYVEAMRNTPLVVQLLFWYALVTVGLPSPQAALSPLEGIYLTNRGLYVPGLDVDGATGLVLLVALAALVGTVLAHRHARRVRLETGRVQRHGWLAAAAGVIAVALTWSLAGVSATPTMPVLGRFNFRGGLTLTPEFVAMMLGLVLYSTAFAAEIIRAGINAIARGQWEAARAIGLPERLTRRLVIIPQALRVIIPPRTSQYISIAKNTTLALVVGYPEIALVTTTTINQTGQAIEGITLLMLVFLSISVAGSLLMNWYNRRIALVER